MWTSDLCDEGSTSVCRHDTALRPGIMNPDRAMRTMSMNYLHECFKAFREVTRKKYGTASGLAAIELSVARFCLPRTDRKNLHHRSSFYVLPPLGARLACIERPQGHAVPARGSKLRPRVEP
jgi:hypothetical protein